MNVSEQMVDDFALVNPDITGHHRDGAEVDMFSAERRLVAMATEALMTAQYRVINAEEQVVRLMRLPHR